MATVLSTQQGRDSVFNIISFNEGIKNNVYLDTAKIPTVGVGFALITRGADGLYSVRPEIENIYNVEEIGGVIDPSDLAILQDMAVNLNNSNGSQNDNLLSRYGGSLDLTIEAESRSLFNHMIHDYETTLIERLALKSGMDQNVAKLAYESLPTTVQSQLIDMAYNASILIGAGIAGIVEDILLGLDENSSAKLWYDIRFLSNSKPENSDFRNFGLDNRRSRNADAVLNGLNSNPASLNDDEFWGENITVGGATYTRLAWATRYLGEIRDSDGEVPSDLDSIQTIRVGFRDAFEGEVLDVTPTTIDVLGDQITIAQDLRNGIRTSIEGSLSNGEWTMSILNADGGVITSGLNRAFSLDDIVKSTWNRSLPRYLQLNGVGGIEELYPEISDEAGSGRRLLPILSDTGEVVGAEVVGAFNIVYADSINGISNVYVGGKGGDFGKEPEAIIQKDEDTGLLTLFTEQTGPDGSKQMLPTFNYGSVIGNSIGQILGLDSDDWVGRTQSVFFSALGSHLQKSITIYNYDEGVAKETRQSFLEGNAGAEFMGALRSSANGYLSSLVMAELISVAGLEDDPKTAEALSAVAGPYADYLVTSLADQVSSLVTGTPVDSAATPPTDWAQWSTIVATYVGSRLADESYDVETREGAIVGSVGASVGAYYGAKYGAKIGAAIGAPLGPIGSFIGAVIGAYVGKLIGGALGDLFGTPPKAHVDVGFDTSTGEFYVDNDSAYSRGGAQKSTARDLAGSAVDMMNYLVQTVGGEVVNGYDLSGGRWGIDKDKLTVSFGDKKRFKKAEDLFNFGVARGISQLELAGGDVFRKRALYRTLEEVLGVSDYGAFLELSRDQVNKYFEEADQDKIVNEDLLTIISGKLSIAGDYSNYFRDPSLIDESSVTDVESNLKATWDVVQIFADDLNLLKRHASDSFGGWRYVVEQELKSEGVTVQGTQEGAAYYSSAEFDFALEAFDFDSVPEDVELSFEEILEKIETRIKERNISITLLNGDKVNLIDEVNAANKGVVDFTNQNALDTVIGEDEYAAYIIKGTESSDTVSSRDLGNDIFGLGGNDTITGGRLNDWIDGGADNDTLRAGGGNNNVLIGGTGNDDLHGAEGSDWLIGGADQDDIWGNDGDDIIEGGAGNGDVLQGGYGNDVYIFRRGSGEDIIHDSDTIAEQKAAYQQKLDEYQAALDAGENPERPAVANFKAESNIIEFESGITLDHIRIDYNGDADQLSIVLLDAETDEVTDPEDKIIVKNWKAENPIEVLRFTDGLSINISGIESFIKGSQGDDQPLNGTNDRDFIHGLSGNDIINALGGNDIAIGGRDNDEVYGDSGDDYLLGGHGVDKIYGGSGNDKILGGIDNDELYGEGDNDTLNGGAGDDKIVLGAGDDLVVFGRGDGKDDLYDLNETGADSGIDTLEFRKGLNIMDVRIGLSDENDDLLFGIEPTNSDDNGISDLPDSIALKAWFGAGRNAIEHVRFYGQTEEEAIDITTVQNWIGSDAGDNTIEASDLSGGFDWITTGGGNDTIKGVRGGDIVNAGSGQDIVEVSEIGNQILAGKGDESDTLGYSELDGAVYANLAAGIFVDRSTLDNGYLALSQADLDAQNISFERDVAVNFENLTGSTHDDILVGDAGENTLHGNGGNDYLVGGYGDDTYVFNRGNGVVTISEFDYDFGIARPNSDGYEDKGTGTDTILFGDQISQDDLVFSRTGDNLAIEIYGTADQVILTNWFVSNDWSIEKISLNNELEINLEDIEYSLSATDKSNWLSGSSISDEISGEGGDDYLFGQEGDDTLNGGEGDDFLFGGDGADHLIGGDGIDAVSYVDSSTGIKVALDNSRISEGDKAAGDTFETIEAVIGSLKADVIRGDAYNNIINGHVGDDVIYGGDGVDTLQGGYGHDTIFGENGSDIITGHQGEDTLYGGNGGDQLSGGDDNDHLYGGAHEDYLIGDGGDDHLYGGSGDDLLLGAADNDFLYGDAGQDDLRGGDGVDTLLGGSGDDKLFGENGVDTLSGEDGNDYLSGGDEEDGLEGDTLYGGAGSDVIEGGSGNDVLHGDADGDTLSGGSGSDDLYGGSGKDILLGGEGNDYLAGGTDSDVYIFAGNFGQDTVYEAPDRIASDELVFSGYELSDLWMVRDGNDLVISVIGTDNSVRIQNYNRFNVNSDAAGAALEQLKEIFDSLTPVESLKVDTQQLDAIALENVIDSMEVFEKPETIGQLPQDVTNALDTYAEESSLQESIDYAPKLVSNVVTLNEDESISGVFVAEDANPNEVFTYRIVEDSPYGTLDLNEATGEYTYTPSSDFSGNDLFKVEVTDSTGLVSTATQRFRVLASDDEAFFAAEVYILTPEVTSINGDLGFTDADNILGDFDTEIIWRDTEGNFIEEQGKFEFDPVGTSFTFTPYESYNGESEVELRFTDRSGRVKATIVHVNVEAINYRPETVDIIEISALEDTPIINVSKIDVLDKDLEDTHRFEIIKEATGTLEVNEQGYLSYTPVANFNGQETFTVRIYDSSGDANSYSDTEVIVTVEAVNDAPEIINSEVNNAFEDTLYHGQVIAEDVDGSDVLSYTLKDGVITENGDQNADTGIGNVTLFSNGEFSYTGKQDKFGSDEFTVIVDDGNGGVVETVVSLIIKEVNDAPVFTQTQYDIPKIDEEQGPIRIALVGNVAQTSNNLTHILATDVDLTDTVRYEIVSLDGELPFEISNGYLRSTKNFDFEVDPIEYSFSINAIDSRGLSTPVDVIVNVKDANDKPTGLYWESDSSSLVIDNSTAIGNHPDDEVNPADVIARFYAEDQDLLNSGEVITFSLEDGSTSEFSSTPGLAITEDGRLYVESFDFSTSYQNPKVYVTATDSAGEKWTESCEIFADVDHAPTDASWIGGESPTMLESGSVVGTIQVEDDDENPGFRQWDFEVTSFINDGANVGTEAEKYFDAIRKVDGDGNVYAEIQRNSTAFSINKDTSYDLAVRISDSNNPDSYIYKVLEFNVANENSAPKAITNWREGVDEYNKRPSSSFLNSENDKNRGRYIKSESIVIRNANSGFWDPEQDNLTFEFVSPVTNFAIDSQSGDISITDPTLLNFESGIVSYFLNIRASDGISTTVNTLTVNIEDLMENELVASLSGYAATYLKSGYTSSKESGSRPNGTKHTFQNIDYSDLRPLRHGYVGPLYRRFIDSDYYFENSTDSLSGNLFRVWDEAFFSMAPVVLNIENSPSLFSSEVVRFDSNSDGVLDVLPWVASNVGLLALDRNYDGIISNGREISFLYDLPGATTDLEGLQAFDSNANGLLDSEDELFSEFLVWQDANTDGISDTGELKTLTEIGIESITLQPLIANTEPTGVDGVELINTSTFTWVDGSQGAVGDVKFYYEEYDIDNPDHHAIVEGTTGYDSITGLLSADRINSLGGNDQVFSGESNDIVNLGSGDDIAFLGEGDDTAYGEDGTDIIYGDAGDDYIEGGAGVDRLYGGDGDDILDGGDDSDYIKGGAGSDMLVGGDGDDAIEAGAGSDTIIGGLGDDSLSGGEGLNQLIFSSGDGHDTVSADVGTYELNLYGILPDDVVIEQQPEGMLFSFGDSDSIFFAVEDTLSLTHVRFDNGVEWDSQLLSNEIERQLIGGITGSTLADIVQGTAGDDLIETYSGNDLVHANAGDDEVYGGAGADELYGELGNDILDGGEGDDTLDGGEGNDRLYGQNGNDTLSGQAGDDIVYAGYGEDLLYGGDGEDSLSGGEGADYLNGADGNDILSGDGGDDVLDGGAGVDELYGGEGNDDLDGGDDDDYLQGDEGDDSLNGGWGNDILNAGSGNDTLIGADGDDVLVADEGDDTLMGGEGTDSLFGDRGNDFLSGGEGTDNLFGGDGNDLYLVDNVEDLIEEREDEGIDTVQSSVNWTLSDHVENIVLLGDALEAMGNNLSNQLTGNELNNILDGAGGADTLIGGAGDDTYIVDNVEDVTTEAEGEGADTVMSSVDYSLADFIENLELTGTALSAVGNSLDNTLQGNDQNNTLEGLDGDDTLSGGLGNDYLDGGIGNDRIVFNAGDGNDFVKKAIGTYAVTLIGISSDSFSFDVSENGVLQLDFGTDGSLTFEGFDLQDSEDTLPLDEIRFENGTDVEIITRDEISYQLEAAIASHVGDADDDYICGTSGSDRIHAMAGDDYVLGYSGDDTLLGGSGNDSLYGGADNDTLLGGDGDDYLKGGSGNDVHDGGAGRDELEGSYGDDIYRFSIGDGVDTVYDASGISEFQFGDGIDAESITLIRDGYHLIVKYSEEDSVTIKYAYEYEWGKPVITDTYTVMFADGTSVNMQDLRESKTVYINGNDYWNTLVGDDGVDNISGGSGADNLYGNAGDDILEGGEGYDDLYGEDGNDSLNGGSGNDDLFGGDGDDTLSGGEGRDDIYGGKGNDIVYGNEGDDDIEGGDGNDILSGGSGSDMLKGGDGDDTYLFARGDESVVIDNHDSGHDVVQISDDIALNELIFERDWYDLTITALDGGEVLEVDHWFVSDSYKVDAISIGGYELNADAIQMFVQAHSSLAGSGSSSEQSSLASQNESTLNNWLAVG